LNPTRKVVEALMDRNEVGDAVDDVILAVDEACSNVIRHAFPDGMSGSYRLCAALDDKNIHLTVEDEGRGVDLDAVDLHGPVDWESTSGRGLKMINRLMTSVEIEAPAFGGTRLTMHKRLLS
jgi:anti-sigma regulatory factor (Ser/Thr protein kinase)